ncbi:MAG: response regulator transcription factor [Nitrosospira sp.]|nr:response regulator transcription factor [Nitrosospira sp.]
MKKVTVAIADSDPARRAKLEQSLQGEQDIKVLTNVLSEGVEAYSERRFKPRADMTEIEDVIARIGRLKPRILFVNLDESTGGFGLLQALYREYPETLLVLLTDKSAKQEEILQALATGVRGCLDHEAAPSYFLKAVRVVDRGEVWVTRKMLGTIMDEVLH